MGPKWHHTAVCLSIFMYYCISRVSSFLYIVIIFTEVHFYFDDSKWIVSILTLLEMSFLLVCFKLVS
jgi:hypothetical protein